MTKHLVGSTVGEVLADVTGRLTAAGCESPRVDAEILVAHVLGSPAVRARCSSLRES